MKQTCNSHDYRTVVYSRYNSVFENKSVEFDESAARRWGKAYDYYLKGWLPESAQASLLDLGCGGGRMLYFLKSRGYQNITGVDISSEQVQLSRQVIKNVIQLDAFEFLDSNYNSFDCIIALDIIEHLKKEEALSFLGRCRSGLTRNGRLILQTPNGDSPWGLSTFSGDFTHETLFNSRSISTLLKISGFSNVEIRETGPPPFGYSFYSTLRFCLWVMIRGTMKLWNAAETGSVGPNILTRNFLISCLRIDD